MHNYLYENIIEFNNKLEENIKNRELNFCRFILPEVEGKVSVVASYLPCHGKKSYVVLNKNLETVECLDFKNYYYGASPIIDNSIIIEAIASLAIKDKDELLQFISKYASEFMLHDNQSSFLLSMARYFVISIAYNYGIELVMQDKEMRYFLQNSDMAYPFIKRSGNNLKIMGCPTKQVLSVLEEYSYKPEKGDVWQCSRFDGEETKNIYEVYKTPGSVKLLNGEVFYSGVMLRALGIEEMSNSFANKNVTSLNIMFERSTYGTVFSLDNNFVEHPLLADCKKKIIEFLHFDDSCIINNLSKDIPDSNPKEYRKLLLQNVNNYLKCSYNVNQVGVSGNIITRDNILITGLRALASIDSKKLYPSINGNAELIDKKVEFYNKSATEDYPSIGIDDLRKDFNGELSREAYAELKLSLKNHEWHCYGITISGMMPQKAILSSKENYLRARRRLHLNIISEQKSEMLFADIINTQKDSIENYENLDLRGIKINYYTNITQILSGLIKGGIKFLKSSKEIITSLITLLLFKVTIFDTNWFSLSKINSFISAIVALLVLGTTLLNIFSAIKSCYIKRKRITSFSIYKLRFTTDKIDWILKKFFKYYDFHPATYAAIRCRIESMLK